jgi:hypothetical protein
MAIENKTVHELPAIASPDGSEEVPVYDGSDMGRVTLTQVANFAGAGDVTGPASATDNAIVRFDLTTGNLIQNSDVTIDNSGSIVIPDGEDIVDGGAGLFARWLNYNRTFDCHFRGDTPGSGDLSGYAWISDSGMGGEPATKDYSWLSDFLLVRASGGPFFLAKSISIISSNVDAEVIVFPNINGNIGWRVDDGTASNYHQMIISGSDGLISISFEQSSGSTIDIDPFPYFGPIILSLKTIISGSDIYGRIDVLNLYGFTGTIATGTAAAISGWAGSGWRSGLYIGSATGYAFCDAFLDERT